MPRLSLSPLPFSLSLSPLSLSLAMKIFHREERWEEFLLPLRDSRHDNFFQHREREMREEIIEWRRERRESEKV